MRDPLPIIFAVSFLAGCGGNSGGPPGNESTGTPIYAIQGDGVGSPLAGQTVTVSAIVTGDFQDKDADDRNDLGGFFVQEAIPDLNPSTSDGIFVFDGNSPTVDVNVGDRVLVTGSVTEFFGETQISATRVEVRGIGSIQPTDVAFPAASLITNSDGQLIPDLEQYEGMLVRFPQSLSVNNLFNLERYGEVQLSQGGRLYQFTNQHAPDVAGYDRHREAIATRSVLLDDGRRVMNAKPVRLLSAGAAPNYSIRSGDVISGLIGNVRYSRASGSSGAETFRLMPTGDPKFISSNPRPSAPLVTGSLSVASFNVLNFFATIDTGQNNCGPSSDEECRGADSTEEFDRQRAKIITALRMIDADIVGLIELENNDVASLSSIVNGLNAQLGAGTYAHVDTGTIGSDVIKTGFLYQPESVSLHGSHALLDARVDERFNDARNRKALAQTFVEKPGGGRLTVVVNHLKSKGSDCDSDSDMNVGDGQGNCNRIRTGAAAAIADWLALDPTASGDPDYLIIGDLNAYLAEDPVTTLKNAGFVNLVEDAAGPEAYSFVFDGQAGALDHALASQSLADQVTEAFVWHINADEPPVLDYNLGRGRDPNLFDADSPYRASDHDPIIIGLTLVH